MIKFGDSLGVLVLWGFYLDSAFAPRFWHPLAAAKLYFRYETFPRCRSGTELLYHHAELGGYGTLPCPVVKEVFVFSPSHF